MTTPSKQTIVRRLRDAGYVALPQMWLPEAEARRVLAMADEHADEVERLRTEPAAPRGRRPKG